MRIHRLISVICIALAASAVAQGENLVESGDFEMNPSTAWTLHAAPPVAAEFSDGTFCLSVPGEAEIGWPHASQQLATGPGDIIEVSAQVKGENLRGGYGAYLSVNYKNAAGERISYTQSPPYPIDGSGWQTIRFLTVVPENTAESRIALLLHGRGTALFDDVEVRKTGAVPAADSEPASVTISAPGGAEPFPLYGFGVEDDGWFYNGDNAAHGVDESDYALRESRIESMDPDVIRMFFWIRDWCPSGDWETFTFDSPNMESHYRTLDLYQRLNAKVIVTGVEWGLTEPYADTEAAASGIVKLLGHLVNERGYTCVKGWTLTNEPDIGWLRSGSSFDEFVTIHREVRKQVKQMGLGVAVIGSDDALGFPWFERSVNHGRYAETVDIWASHFYLKGDDRFLADARIASRMKLLKDRSLHQPFVVTEFGFQDDRSSVKDNPIMKGFDYALWTSAFVIDGLNAGAAGFVIWCVHASQYPGGTFMNYGLWDYKNEGWQLRPVYHAWSMFCRETEPGDNVRVLESSAPHWVKAVRVDDVVFWVNQAQRPVDAVFRGMPIENAAGYSSESVGNDAGPSVRIERAGEAYRLPARSFGYVSMGEDPGN